MIKKKTIQNSEHLQITAEKVISINILHMQ